MSLFWSSPRKTIHSEGPLLRFDPMVGAGRYRRASDWLTSSGLDIALASFSFDPAAPGSVVLGAERYTESRPTPSGGIPGGTILEDGREAWEQGFQMAMRALSEDRVNKVVLARQARLDFGEPIPLDSVLSRLVENNPRTYVFSVDGLVGASPELLVSVEDDLMTALVLAGTASTQKGLATDKIAAEHRYAADSVRAALSPLTVDLAGEQSVLGFGAINHVGTRFVGRIEPGTGVLDLVASLHPNAAVCGAPSEAALDLIRTMEPSGRDRYAGPVGWFDRVGNGEFSLALRCGLVRSHQMTLYAGGGLVTGSSMVSEWEETQLKLSPMMQALGLD